MAKPDPKDAIVIGTEVIEIACAKDVDVDNLPIVQVPVPNIMVLAMDPEHVDHAKCKKAIQQIVTTIMRHTGPCHVHFVTMHGEVAMEVNITASVDKSETPHYRHIEPSPHGDN